MDKLAVMHKDLKNLGLMFHVKHQAMRDSMRDFRLYVEKMCENS